MMMWGTISRSAVLAILVGGIFVGATPAQAQLGIGGGLNFNNMDDIDAGSVEGTFEGSTGYHIGAFYNFGAGPVDLRPGIFYYRIGRFDFPDAEDLDLRAVEIPLDVRFKPTVLRGIHPYVLGAPVVSFARSSSDSSDAFEDVSLGADVGVGVELSLPGMEATLMPELRYGIGVTDYVSDSFDVGDTTVHPASGARRPSKVTLRLNIAF